MNPETERFRFVLSTDAVEERDWNGPFPDQNAAISNINEQPAFHAFCQEYRSSAQRDIIKIPVTAGFNLPSFYSLIRLHNLIIRPPFSWLRIDGMLWHSKLLRKIYLSPERHTSDDMISLVKACLKSGHNLFRMNLHSSNLIEGITGLTQVAYARESICSRIADVVSFQKNRMKPTTVLYQKLKFFS